MFLAPKVKNIATKNLRNIKTHFLENNSEMSDLEKSKEILEKN